ncbi:fumarylacetoacetate hydrolase [Fusarium mexicanum]|uniref:Fumarylacetoacetase n=1 Tax=Fusarium mexicanum TaxID=751941 RepID=A0A8H5I3G2_9HYPO|nr:fumarylacetoacetate hydrolase [Fusarium mexicanum]
MCANIRIPKDSPFSIHNIPFGVISTPDNKSPRCAAAIGNHAIDLAKLAESSRLDHLDLGPFARDLFSKPYLNDFAALPRISRQALRESLINDITHGRIPEQCLVDLDNVVMHLPMQIQGFSDFYCSLEHVQNCSETMVAGASIPENWFYAPSVYNSRVSSVIASGRPVRRPYGVYYGDDGKPTYGASREIDYELEMGFFVSKPVSYGSVMNISDVEEHIFGFVLLNDWSSRDLQTFEMKPLGPFHGKGFGTSISPWIVTLEALKPFQCAPKWEQKPPPFDHLRWTNHHGTYDIKLEVELNRNGESFSLGTSNLRYLYWTPFQQLAHHASAMCGLQTGDLIGTGTISGDTTDSEGRKLELGCLYEATKAGTKEAEFSNGFQIKYLHDGDEVVLRGHCGNKDCDGVFLGFGECRAILLPAFDRV